MTSPDPGAVADLAVGVVGGCPDLGWDGVDRVDRVDDGVGQGETQRLLHVTCRAVVEEVAGSATGICAHQDFPADPVAGLPR